MTSTLVQHNKRTIRRPCSKCGRTDLYWAHDIEKTAGEKPCDHCKVTGKFTLIEMDGSRHVHNSPAPDGTPPVPWDVEATPTPVTVSDRPVKTISRSEIPDHGIVVVDENKKEVSEPVSKPVVATDGSAVQQALAMLTSALSPQIDKGEILAMVKAEISNVVFPTKVIVERATGDRKEVSGNTHHKLADVVTCLMAEEHVMMVGPAGTGKSTIAEQAAEALGLESFAISLSPQTPASQLLGYMQATGEYVSSLFRQAYENGGVFHFDEVDNAHPSVLAVINSALANGRMAFPDRMVKRHSDFRAVASANTYGRGADRKYVGRSAIDAATLDRFTIQTIEVDESLETALCKSVSGIESDTADRVLKYVRKVRASVARQGLHVVVSPRASLGMCRLLAANMTWEAAVEARVRRGMTDAEWAKVIG